VSVPKEDSRFHSRNRRVMPRLRTSVAIVAGMTIAGWAAAQAAPRPEALIKWRQSAYQVIAWNSGRIKAALGGKYDAAEVRAAANALAAVANAGLPDLFAPGTAAGKGWRETTASRAVFDDSGKFRALNEEFAQQASELARVAAAGSQQAVNDQFLKVAKACKACHEKYRQTD
jgi:cytochrome c556